MSQQTHHTIGHETTISNANRLTRRKIIRSQSKRFAETISHIKQIANKSQPKTITQSRSQTNHSQRQSPSRRVAGGRTNDLFAHGRGPCVSLSCERVHTITCRYDVIQGAHQIHPIPFKNYLGRIGPVVDTPDSTNASRKWGWQSSVRHEANSGVGKRHMHLTRCCFKKMRSTMRLTAQPRRSPNEIHREIDNQEGVRPTNPT
jgi:hypothetical protein